EYNEFCLNKLPPSITDLVLINCVSISPEFFSSRSPIYNIKTTLPNLINIYSIKSLHIDRKHYTQHESVCITNLINSFSTTTDDSMTDICNKNKCHHLKLNKY